MAGRYARIYFDAIAQDDKFAPFRNDHAVMGCWLLLLIEAEKAWPAPAFRPPTTWVPARHFRTLVAAGVVDLEADGRFAIHGLDSERKVRSDRGKDAAGKRWAADSNATGIADSNAAPEVLTGMPNVRAGVVSSASPAPLVRSLEGGVGGDDDRPDIEAYLAVRFRLPTPKQRELMDDYCRVFDLTGPDRSAQIILRHPDDPIGALKADLAEFRQERVAAAKLQDIPKPRRRKGSGLSGVNAELAALFREQDAARLAAEKEIA